MPTVLTSKWDGLSSQLIAAFYPVHRVAQGDGERLSYRWEQMADEPEVRAPITDGNADHAANWNSPFENTGVDQKYSSFSALLQSGALEPLAAIVNQFLTEKVGVTSGDVVANQVSALEGKTGVTKLNSMQIYNGSPPSKITVTAHFRAYSDPFIEVEKPLQQLIAWALPRSLADDGFLLSMAKGGSANPWPSETPQVIAMKYAGRLFSPLVIEGAPYAITGQRDSKGNLVSAQIQLTMGALTAIDAKDWGKIMKGQVI
jgi:hypothetical protein